MDTQTDINPDQTDEDILTYTVSDEALEAAAGMDRGLMVTGRYTDKPICC